MGSFSSHPDSIGGGAGIAGKGGGAGGGGMYGGAPTSGGPGYIELEPVKNSSTLVSTGLIFIVTEQSVYNTFQVPENVSSCVVNWLIGAGNPGTGGPDPEGGPGTCIGGASGRYYQNLSVQLTGNSIIRGICGSVDASPASILQYLTNVTILSSSNSSSYLNGYGTKSYSWHGGSHYVRYSFGGGEGAPSPLNRQYVMQPGFYAPGAGGSGTRSIKIYGRGSSITRAATSGGPGYIAITLY